MNINKSEVHGVVVIKIDEKRFDASVSPFLKQFVMELIEEGKNRIVLDLDAVEFIDSSGLGSLVGVLKSIGSDGQLVVSNVQPQAKDLLKLTRMDRVLSIYDSTEQAIASIA